MENKASNQFSPTFQAMMDTYHASVLVSCGMPRDLITPEILLAVIDIPLTDHQFFDAVRLLVRNHFSKKQIRDWVKE